MNEQADAADDLSGFVPVLFARNLREAEFYQILLEDHDLTVLIEQEYGPTPDELARGRVVPVLVPEEHLAEAQEIIEQRSSLDDEFDEDFEDHPEPDEQCEGLSRVNLDEVDVERFDDEPEDLY